MKTNIVLLLCLIPSASSVIWSYSEPPEDQSLQWLHGLIRHLVSTSPGTLDAVMNHKPSTDTLFNKIRIDFGEHFGKYESTIHGTSKRKILYLLDGSNGRQLTLNLARIKTTLGNRREVIVVVVNGPITHDHVASLRSSFFCHKILVEISPLNIYRVSSADGRLLTYGRNSSFEMILDDRRDWKDHVVRIMTIDNFLPRSAFVNGQFVGTDIETCKAIFESARMRYRFVVNPKGPNHLETQQMVGQVLDNGTIDIVVGFTVFESLSFDRLNVYDRIGACLMLPKNLQRNFIYHLTHPFELETWLVIVAVLVLDYFLTRLFPSAFPHNLIIILIFGDSLPDHHQTRWTRFYCFACTVLLFLFTEAYLAKAMLYMTVTRYTPDVRTLAEAIESGINVKAPIGTKVTIDRNTLPLLWERTIEERNFPYTMDNDEFAYLIDCTYGSLLIQQHVERELRTLGHREAKRRFYLLEEMISWTQRFYTIARHFTFRDHLMLATVWCFEGGLWDHWKDAFRGRAGVAERTRLWDENDVLSLEDMVAIWLVLAFGWTISVGVFLVEAIWGVNLMFRVQHLQ